MLESLSGKKIDFLFSSFLKFIWKFQKVYCKVYFYIVFPVLPLYQHPLSSLPTKLLSTSS